ncbi:MAG: hypothetical protein RMN52_11510 [Anaerolineae bacterium]|nr:hypothetical protein [Candidatus Roseilinea sp.]MDW8450618.1 hypothetical protein [Anaerolineae bacterium]
MTRRFQSAGEVLKGFMRREQRLRSFAGALGVRECLCPDHAGGEVIGEFGSPCVERVGIDAFQGSIAMLTPSPFNALRAALSA